MKQLFFAFLVGIVSTTASHSESMKMAVTTSFHNSGLSEVLLPEIEKDLGLEVQLLVVGTGQAIRLGEAGDVDAILVHSKSAEERFVSEGFAEYRREIMYNDFVIVGPISDPASVAEASSIGGAFGNIAVKQSLFVSRGDDSGTHKKERSLWSGAGINPDPLWYREAGAGMGAALNTASGMGAYILADRASWLKFANKADMALLYSGDPVLFNQYAFLPVSAKKHPHVNSASSTALEAWLVSDRAKDLIDGYRLGGAQLFTFNAK